MERLLRGKTSAVTVTRESFMVGLLCKRKEDLCMLENQQIREYKIFLPSDVLHTQYLKSQVEI